jgi:C1A family cysteine protease
MKALAVVLVLAVAVTAVTQREAEDQFVEFVARYSKNYATTEVLQRFSNFKATLQEIERHNAANLTWTMGVNEYADMSYDEFAAKMLTGFDAASVQYDPSAPVREYKGEPLPNDVDWRTSGAVSPVKNQGSCGSCWAFGTTGAIESANKIKTGQMVLLSEQQLVDCAGSSGNQGCNGGLPSSAYNWIRANGICSAADYPYTGRDGTCKKTCKPVVRISGATNVGKTEAAHQAAVTQQPLSIGIDATQLKNYKSGIFQGPCGTSLNHAVLTIGWTADSFILKNSWGTSFGEQGFFRFARNKNLCGMLNVVNYPTIA